MGDTMQALCFLAMLKETAYGIIPLKLEQGSWKVFLVQHKKSFHWGFPKGKEEKGETPQKTALRELREETSLELKSFLQESPFFEEYCFERNGQSVAKTVGYFLGEVFGLPKICENELMDSGWFLLKEARGKLTFENASLLLENIEKNILNNLEKS